MAKCLSKYCAFSSQNIDVEKSRLSSSHGVYSQFLTHIWNQRGLKLLPKGEKYLGVPLFFSRCKKKDFAYLKESNESKVSGWKSKRLSWMGCATLINAVA